MNNILWKWSVLASRKELRCLRRLAEPDVFNLPKLNWNDFFHLLELLSWEIILIFQFQEEIFRGYICIEQKFYELVFNWKFVASSDKLIKRTTLP